MKESAKPVRIDPELYELLALEAKAQGRSTTAQVNHTLKVAIVRGLTQPPLTEAQRTARNHRSHQRALSLKAKLEVDPTLDISDATKRFIAASLSETTDSIRFNNPKDKEYKIDQEF
jgi:hypothetical protein